MSEPEAYLFLFPGQGAQYRGMGSDLHAQHASVQHTYAEASDVLGYDIASLSFDDSGNDIHHTRYTQPAILTHSVACLRLFNQFLGQPVTPTVTAGHSLGEYSALVAAGVLDFSSALQLVSTRGELMGAYGSGEMEALPLDQEQAGIIAAKHYCAVAACNLPDQTVVGGLAEDLDALASDLNEQFPKKRSTRLKTEGAFHTYLMVEAAKRFRPVLEQIDFRATEVLILSNYTGDFHETGSAGIRSRLFLQLFYPVLWHQSLLRALDRGIGHIIEFGGGIGKGETPAEKNPNLAGIVKRTFRRVPNAPDYHSVINIESLAVSVTAIADHRSA